MAYGLGELIYGCRNEEDKCFRLLFTVKGMGDICQLSTVVEYGGNIAQCRLLDSEDIVKEYVRVPKWIREAVKNHFWEDSWVSEKFIKANRIEYYY